MVEDLSQSNNLFLTSKSLAFGRLKTLKERQGYYHPAPLQFGQDTVAFQKPVQKVDDQAPRFVWVRTVARESLKIGFVVAASILGGIVGGGVLGAVLAGAGASGLVSAIDQLKQKGMIDKGTVLLDTMIGAIPAGLNSAADKLLFKSDSKAAKEMIKDGATDGVKQIAKERLKKALVSAAIKGSVDGAAIGYIGGFAHTAYNDAKAGRFTLGRAHDSGARAVVPGMISGAVLGGGFQVAANRFKVVNDRSGASELKMKLLGERSELLYAIPVHNLTESVGIIDLGSNGCKMVMLEPGDHKPVELRREIDLGKFLNDGKPESVEQAMKDVESALTDFKKYFADHDVKPENIKVVATAGLRDAVDSKGVLLADRLSEKLGFPIEIIDPVTESGLLYNSVMRGHHRMNPHQENVVVEVGGGSTEFAFGKGQRALEEELTAQGHLPIGSNSLGIEDPFSPIDVALGRDKIKTMLPEHIADEAREAVAGRTAFLGRSKVYQTLAIIEAQRPGGGRSLMSEGLSTETMDWYLSPEGLAYLQKLDLAGTHQDKLGKNSIADLVQKLAILREAAAYMGIERFQFGAGGGLKVGLLDDAVRQQIQDRAKTFAAQLQNDYRQEYPKARKSLEKVFPDFVEHLQGRAKDNASIQDKLVRKSTRAIGDQHSLSSLENARQLIGDGHGLSLVLDEVSRKNIEKVRDNLIQAVRNGDLQILEINNYRGHGNDGMPYFTQEDVERIRMAVEAKRMRMPHQSRPPRLVVTDGPGASKPSGYTSTQLNVQLRNTETGEFDLPQCEFQIRGSEVDEFYAAEHLSHDIRQAKNIYKNERVREVFEPQVKPLLKAISGMSAAQYKTYTNYLSEYYLYCRRLESGQVVPEPVLPASLPQVCNVQELKRLSKLQKELLKKYTSQETAYAR